MHHAHFKSPPTECKLALKKDWRLLPQYNEKILFLNLCWTAVLSTTCWHTVYNTKAVHSDLTQLQLCTGAACYCLDEASPRVFVAVPTEMRWILHMEIYSTASPHKHCVKEKKQSYYISMRLQEADWSFCPVAAGHRASWGRLNRARRRGDKFICITFKNKAIQNPEESWRHEDKKHKATQKDTEIQKRQSEL